METFIFIGMAITASFAGFLVGKSRPRPATTTTPAPQPKIFGLSEFERLMGAIPPTADDQTKNLVVMANTSLVVGFLGFEDRVVPEAEEAIAKNLVTVRQNDERIASLAEEVSQIRAQIDKTKEASQTNLVRVETLSALKRLKAS